MRGTSKGFFICMAVILSVLLAFGAPASAAQHPFKDVISRYDEAVSYFYNAGVINGKSKTEFGTYDSLKRGDAAVILARALNLDTANAPDAGFKDVNSRIKGYVNALVKEDIINGFSDTIFSPDTYLTRGQMAAILVRAYNLEKYAKPTPFTDLSITFKDEIEALYGAGITGGVSATKYGTNELIKRGDFAVLLYKTIKLSEAGTVKSVNALNPIHVPLGAFLSEVNLPQTVGVVFNDGSAGTRKVQWNTTGLNLNSTGEYTLQGTIEGTTLPATVKVVVHNPSVQQLNDITVVKGTSLANVNLPKQVKLVYNNGLTVNRNVTWNTTNLDLNKAGTYVLNGEIERLSRYTTIKVIVTDISVEKLQDIYVTKGTELKDVPLPTQVKLFYGDNTYEYRNVTWNVSGLNLNQSGEYVLTGALANTQWTTTVKVIVTGAVDPVRVELNTSAVTLQKGTSIQLNAVIYPSEVTNKNVTWTSSNNSVATVNQSGKVTAVAKGQAVIVVTTANGKTATATITVVDNYVPNLEVNAYTGIIENNRIKRINFNIDNNGNSTVTLDKIEVYEGVTIASSYTKSELENRNIVTSITPNMHWTMYIDWSRGLNPDTTYVKVYIKVNGETYVYTREV